ncbi:5-formyltetrahydrofolate cyclo-ligase [Streptomyces sp. MI02-7b]|uniref:5-formyltetrahydrofolate cyclo-ligase n=1 Tax=Streptomyces sp. MI02-7b TaxID=462941 RepID=UPI0029AB0896|nr:5-formyltetrahydrofolate cyclo-ligase [Streptomyces sp. MI02-7b]MDX3074961.1 5-formyltetrahydrofolate cyclo-ligase [Streptomyces sp. MI02-7b]
MSGSHGSKAELRKTLLRMRSGFTEGFREEAERGIARHALELPELSGASRTVAAYVSMGAEPGTRALLEALRERGARVLLPVLLPDNDLDWAAYEGPDALVRTSRGLYEPTGRRLGPDAVTGAHAVLLPGLAADANGLRLGRGGGSYDRVLTRLEAGGATPALVVLLYGHEVLEHVPAEPHDRPVDAVVTPDGVRRFGRPGSR